MKVEGVRANNLSNEQIEEVIKQHIADGWIYTDVKENGSDLWLQFVKASDPEEQ